ncbi:MAG: DUF3298 domain-containing protein [Acutalibacteraceae bacterium]
MLCGKCSVREKTVKKKLRVITALLVAAMLLLSACGKSNPEGGESELPSATDGSSVPAAVTTIDVEKGHYFDYYWDNVSDRMAVYLEYPYMHLSGEDRKAYPKLEESVSQLMNERKEERLKIYEDAVDIFNEEIAYNPEYSKVYEVTEEVFVRRADTRVLSLVFDVFNYWGGAHGSPYITGVVFDTETGEKLALTDVVTDVKLLPDLVEEQLEKFFDTDYLYGDLNLQTYFDENLDTIQWVLDYHGVTVFFNPYDIAPFASGIFNVTITFAEHPELFKEKYRTVPENYGVELSLENNFYYDVDGDGTQDSLFVSAYKGETEGYTPQIIRLNDLEYEEETGIFEIEPMLIHTAAGKNYLYIGMMYPNDIWVYSVYNVSNGAVKKIDTVDSERHHINDYANDYSARQVLTNPQSFVLDTFTNMLGTGYGYAEYHVGADGLPVNDNGWHIIEYQVEFTMLRDVTVSLVSEAGKNIGKTTLKTGDKVTYYRTDNEGWADLKLSDGSIARVNVVCQDGNRTVDGIDIEKVFDGIEYAI